MLIEVAEGGVRRYLEAWEGDVLRACSLPPEGRMAALGAASCAVRVHRSDEADAALDPSDEGSWEALAALAREAEGSEDPLG